MPPVVPRSDEELTGLDVPGLIREGLGTLGPGRRELFGDGAVAAAIQADRHRVIPRSITFLAEVVRRGGVRYAAELPEPLPQPAQAELARQWLGAAHDLPEVDEELARWLDAVAVILDVRQRSRTRLAH
jgi:hypothetical protein